MRPRIAIVIILLFACPAVARAQSFDQGNAANWYRVAISRADSILASLPPEERSRRLRRLAVYAAAPGETPPPDVRDLLARLEPVLRVVHRAASAPTCDFEPAEPPGFDRTLAHHASMRRFTHCLVADALIRFNDGNLAAGCESLAASYRLAAHAGQDRLLAGALYGSSLFKIADRVTQHAVDRGRVDAPGSTAILAALGRIDPGAPFGFADALEVEPAVIAEWWHRSYAGDDAVRRFLDDHRERIGDPARQTEFALMSPATIEADLETFAAFANRAAEAFAMDDVEEARIVLGALDAQAARAELGVFARLLSPSVTELYDRHLRMLELLDRRVDTLVAIADGRTMPEDAANAAVWYRRAIERHDALSPQDRRLLAAFADDPAPPVAEGLPASLEHAQPVVELVRRATALPRCEFRDARAIGPLAVASYHGPLRRLATLLHADALFAIQRDDFDRVVDRFALCFRMAGHLSDDERIVSSLIADEIFASTLNQCEPGLRADLFTVEQRMRLVSAARGAGYRDTFGYERAVTAQRDDLKRWIVEAAAAPPPVSAYAAGQALQRCDGDQVLFLVLAIDRMTADRRAVDVDERERELAMRWTALDGVISTRSLVHALEKVPQVRAIIEERRVNALALPIAPPIGRVVARHEKARTEFGRALLTLRGEEPTAAGVDE